MSFSGLECAHLYIYLLGFLYKFMTYAVSLNCFISLNYHHILIKFCIYGFIQTTKYMRKIEFNFLLRAKSVYKIKLLGFNMFSNSKHSVPKI